jgi:excisionase family DNA binding protein
MKDEIISVREASQILNVSTQRVYQMIREGKFAPIRVGKLYFLKSEEVEKIKHAEAQGAA